MVESIFIIVLVAFLFQFCQFYENYKIKPSNFILWITLPWCTAILGAYWAMLGVHYATPTRVKPIVDDSIDRLNWVERLFQNAFMMNFIALGLPVILCTTVAIPSVMANALYSKAESMQDEWQERYKYQTIFTQEMIIEAQLIWYKVLSSAYLASITFFLWFVWAVVCWIIYSAITIRLILTIRSELNKAGQDDFTFIVSTAHPKIKGIISQGQSEGLDRESQRITIEEVNMKPLRSGSSFTENESGGDSSLNFKMKSLPVLPSNIGQSTSTLTQSERTGILSTTLDDKSIGQSQMYIQVNPPKSSTSFFKSFLPNLILTDEEESTRFTASLQDSRSEQKKEMRKAFLQIFVQFLVVSPGCGTFASIALFMALTIHPSFEQPSKDRLGNRFEYFGIIALLCVVYAVIIFGCGASFALLQRTYEPVFSAITASSSNGTHSRNTAAHSSSISSANKVYQSIQNVEPRLGIGQSPIVAKKEHKKGKTTNHHIISTFFETKTRDDYSTIV